MNVRRCAEKDNCRYSNTPRAINRTQKRTVLSFIWSKRSIQCKCGNDKWITMGNKNFIPKTTETESHVANKTGGSAQTIYKQVPAGAVVTKIFYRFNGQDHYGAPASSSFSCFR